MDKGKGAKKRTKKRKSPVGVGKPGKTKYYMFTLANPLSGQDAQEISALTSRPEKVRYCKWAHEVGEGGLEHLQGYICFDAQSLTMDEALRVLDKVPGVHLDVAEGTHEQCKAYPGKFDKSGSVRWVAEYGSDEGIPSREKIHPKSSGLLALKAEIDSGADELSLWNKHFVLMCLYYRAIYAYIDIKIRQASKEMADGVRLEPVPLKHFQAVPVERKELRWYEKD